MKKDECSYSKGDWIWVRSVVVGVGDVVVGGGVVVVGGGVVVVVDVYHHQGSGVASGRYSCDLATNIHTVKKNTRNVKIIISLL